jgi:hypothetical protein
MRMPVSIAFVLALGPEVCRASSLRRLAPISCNKISRKTNQEMRRTLRTATKVLMHEFQQGSRAAFEQLYARYSWPLYGFFPAAAGKSAARGRRGPGNFSCSDSRCSALRAASAGADVLVRNRAEAAGVGAAPTAWKRRQSGSSSRAICSEHTRVWVLGAESLSQT